MAGEAIDRAGAVALCLRQIRGLQRLEVLRGVRDRQLGLGGERLDVAGRLGQQVDELEPFVAGEGGADAGELRVDAVLELSMTHAPILPAFAQIPNSSTYRLTS